MQNPGAHRYCSLAQLSAVIVAGFATHFLTPAETWYPLNVAPPSGTTRASLEMTPKDNLIYMRSKTQER
jgi:hypothetical protein